MEIKHKLLISRQDSLLEAMLEKYLTILRHQIDFR